jgi:hypothetical protein
MPHAKVTLSTTYQWLKDLLKTFTDAQGLAEYRTNFKKIKLLYPNTGAAGTIYVTRNPNLSDPAFFLENTGDEENKTDERHCYNETTTGLAIKSTTNGDFLLVELED